VRTTERQEAEAECAEKTLNGLRLEREELGKQGIGVRGRTGGRMWTSAKEGGYLVQQGEEGEEGRGKATYLRTTMVGIINLFHRY